MFVNAFIGHSKPPTKKELTSVLGDSYELWQQFVADTTHELKLDAQEWGSYSIKAGWSLRLLRKKRRIVYLVPAAGCFQAAFALGDKAVTAVRNSKLPAFVLKMIREAKRYPEGTFVRLEIHTAKDMEIATLLAKIKSEN